MHQQQNSASTHQTSPQSVGHALEKSAVKYNLTPDHPTGDSSPTGKQATPNLKALGAPPPKVALVSVYVVDPVKKIEAKNMATTKWMKLEHAKQAANRIFETGFPGMKEEFAKYGMDLLAPAEFLTDEKKKKFYKEFKLKHPSRPVKYAENFLWGMTHHSKSVIQPADGFGEIYLMSAESMRAGTTAYDKTLAERLGNDLTKGLDVNAVMIVLSQFTVKDEKTVHDETSMYMFGPNPILKEGQDKDPFHHIGHTYAGMRAPYDFTFEGTAENPDNFKDYDNLLRTLSHNLGEYLLKETGFVGAGHISK